MEDYLIIQADAIFFLGTSGFRDLTGLEIVLCFAPLSGAERESRDTRWGFSVEWHLEGRVLSVVAFLAWMATQGKIMSIDNLIKRRNAVINRCCM